VRRWRVSGRLVAALAVAALVVPASATAAASPAELSVRVVKSSLRGAQGAQWDVLHPKYKRVVAKSRFIACERQAAAGLGKITLKGVQAQGTRVIPATLPLLGKVEVEGVAVLITYSRRGVKGNRMAEIELFWVHNRGKYVRIIVPDEYKAYKAGRCP
jgi:hypothetical protein